MSKYKDYTIINECRLCKTTKLKTVLDFGAVPLANSYPESQSSEENFYQMTVVKCEECGHVQLRETIKPEILFKDYSYASSDSPSLVTHFKEFANTISERLSLNKQSSILEIGCNDGILLKQFAELGFENLYGVEPATNMSERALGCGALIFNRFFNVELATSIKRNHGAMKIVCANNVFAHVADVDSMIEGVVALLDDNGIFIFENAYLLDTIQGLYFDQVYHEHLQYYGVIPLVRYLNQFGLDIFDIQRVQTQGGSFRIYAKKKDYNTSWVNPSVGAFIAKETSFDLYNDQTFCMFQKSIDRLAEQIRAFVQTSQSEGKTICCYGCPAKFALFSKVFGLTQTNIKYVVDDSPLKQGRFSPGKKIPIVPRQHFIDNPTDYCLISVWNMSGSVMSRNPEFKGKWVIPMPVFQII